MTHNELWCGIVNLAKEMHLTCSGLARVAGLDSTIFNKSKRVNNNGTLRWPSTYSIARILDAAGIGLEEFSRFLPHDTPNNWAKHK